MRESLGGICDKTQNSESPLQRLREGDGKSLVGFGFRKTRCNRTRSATEEVRERERERAMAARKGLFGLASTRAGEAAINWYPGHMASATKAIRERIKLVDLVLEVRDARVCLKPFHYYSLPCHVCVFLALVVLSSFCLFSCTFSDTIVISKCRAARCIGAQEAPDCS